jgi:PAT family beta-lactamase induction signal transducer AmpG
MSTRTKLAWVAALYFAEGFPYGLVFDTYTTYFAASGVSLAALGFFWAVRIGWVLKFLWAPAVAMWGERRHWFIGCQLLIALLLLLTPGTPPTEITTGLWVLLFAMAFLSSTQDIAIDAYTIELVDAKEMGPANGVRQAAYRVAIITAGGLLIWLAGRAGWTAAFWAGAVLLVLTALVSTRAPRVSRVATAWVDRRPLRERAENVIMQPLRLFVARDGLGSFLAVLGFVLLFRLGEFAIGPMVRPFWLRARGMSLEELGTIVGVFGPIWTVLGALLAGWLTQRWGIFRALWILGLFQGGSNLAYAAVTQLPLDLRWPIYVASALESICSGLGSTPFMAFLMVICAKRYATTQFALLSSLFSLSGLLVSIGSGWITQRLGYAPYFVATFLLSFTAYAFLPWVRRWVRDTGGDTTEADDAGPSPVPAAS